jgi:hypothetical protein
VIKIVGVNPNSGLVDGVATDFSVSVEYFWDSHTSDAVIQVGFNTSAVDAYTIVVSETVVVHWGSNFHTFWPNVVPKDWGPVGDFKAYASITQPLGVFWPPIDFDTMVLTFF